MRWLSLLLFLASLLSACSSDEDIPEYVLPEKKLVPILIDLHLCDADVGRIVPNKEEGILLYLAREKSIMKRHGVRQGQVDSTIHWYSKHPKQFKEVYQKVVDSMVVLESSKRQ
jgi:hypothetical protein